MKKLLFLLCLFLPMAAFSQSTEQQSSPSGEEEQYYLYNIVSFEGDFTEEDFKVYYDDGYSVKRLRDGDGKKLRFRTPAAALMFFLSDGWEMYMSGATSSGSSFQGTGSSNTSSYWILRKPCTKEEYEQVIQYAVVKY